MLLFLMFFSPLLGVSGFWYIFFVGYYLLRFFKGKLNNTRWGVSFSLLYVAFLFAKFYQISNFSIWFSTVKFYMGWAIVSLFLFYSKITFNVNKLLFLLCCEILTEFVLINTIVSVSILPNYPQTDIINMTGSFVRVYSIGNNATTTSTIVVMLLACRESLNKNGLDLCGKILNRVLMALSLMTIIVLGSGTGFCLYLIYLLYKHNLFKIRLFLGLCLVLIGIVSFLSYITIDDESIFQRLSGEYFQFLWDYKEYQISELLDQYKVTNHFWGSALKNEEVALIWGDFAFLQYYISLGILGNSLFVMYVLKYANKVNFFPLLIGIIGAFHYGGIFTFPGQLLLAYLILLNKKK